MENLDFILNSLLEEQHKYLNLTIPPDLAEKRALMRSLLNTRHPQEASDSFLKAQDQELQSQRHEKGIVELSETLESPWDKRLRLWQGDITRFSVDVIVNAANNQMLGCFVPLHGCIDNAIHSAAGIQLRLECNDYMKLQGHLEPTGSVMLTKGYNLPAKYVLHTVGPIISATGVTAIDQVRLASCYKSCLWMADKNKLRSIAFCCISTGEYRFPNHLAAEIAVTTVREYFNLFPATGIDTVVFNVFKDTDYSIYHQLLQFEHE